jgi:protein phosphatase methylesterase 1
LTWTDFFDQELFLPEEVDNLHIVHHVYLTPPTDSGPLFVMHHGAGSSGLSFATCAEGILSLDARSHGRTVMTTLNNKTVDESPSTADAAQAECSGKVELDLSLETLSRDLVHVIYQTQTRMGWEKLPDIVLVGHSLGGAVITDVAKKGELGPRLLAYAVLDVVEGTLALAVYMYQILIPPLDRVCNGCSTEHGEISFDSPDPIPLPAVWD